MRYSWSPSGTVLNAKNYGGVDELLEKVTEMGRCLPPGVVVTLVSDFLQ